MNLKILAKDHKEIYRKFGKELKKSRVAIDKENKTNTKYLVATYEENPIGVVGFCYISNNHIRFKTDFVNYNFRGKKIYTDLWNARLNTIFKNKEINTISAYCTEMSLPKYLRSGFVIQSVNKKKITYVKKIIYKQYYIQNEKL